MILLDAKDNAIKEPQKDLSFKKTYIPEEESLPSVAGRSAYKIAQEMGSTALGGIPSIWNTLASLGSSLAGEEDGVVPQFPEFMTKSGVKETLFKPLGEEIWGKGAMDPQEGFGEELTSRAAEILPYSFMGPGGIGGALATTGTQALAGQTAKELGGGELAQTLSELGAGMGVPILSKLASGKFPQAAKEVEKQLWKQTYQKGKDIGRISVDTFKEAGNVLMNKAEALLPKVERKMLAEALGESENILGKIAAKPTDLIDTSKKFFNLTRHIKSGEGRRLVHQFRSTINQDLDKVIQSYPEARSLTRAIKQHPDFEKSLNKASESSRPIIDAILKVGKLGALPIAFKLGGAPSAVGVLATGGAYLGKKAFDNYKLINSSPTLKKMVIGSVRDIAKTNLYSASRKIDKITSYLNKKDEKENGASGMILVDD